jgi:cytochrome c556
MNLTPDTRPAAKLFSLLLLGATCLLVACGGEPADTHPDQPVSKRRALFKQFTRTLEPMGMVARDRLPYKHQEFLSSALALQSLVVQPWKLFGPDSNYPPTHANAAVWGRPADFKQAQEHLQRQVDELALAAQADDLDRIRSAVNEVQKSCKACHNQFHTDR